MSEVLAKVAGEEITAAEVDLIISNLPKEQQAYAAHPQFRAQCLEQLISVRLFAKLGADEKIEETKEFEEIMAGARRDILAQMAMANAVKGANVTEEEMIKKLGEMTPDNLLVLVTVSVPSDLTKMSVNLQGPIIINVDERKACQVIVDSEKYPVKFYIYEILKARKAGE